MKRNDICNLAIYIITTITVMALIVLTCLLVNTTIDWVQYVICLTVCAVILTVEQQYIKRHYVNGEWM